MTSRGPRGPYAKGVEKRHELRRIALEIFDEQGPDGTSLHQIAERADITVAGVLHHFSSKDALLASALGMRELDPCGTPGPAESLAAVMRANAGVPGLVPLFVYLAVESKAEDRVAHDQFAEHYAQMGRVIADEVRSLQEAGEFRQDADPSEVASLLIATADGIQLQWMYDPTIDMAGRVLALWELMRTARDPSVSPVGVR